jgi:hypothetical protein
MADIWRVYRIKKCRHTSPQKPKFVVIVCKDKDYMGFLVNSDISQFILNKPDMLACQIKLTEDEYHFLFQESYLDCAQLYPFKDSELITGLEIITDKTKTEIKKVVSTAKTITKYQRQLILNS